MKTAKFAGPIHKPKPAKKTHITKKEYRNLTAARVDSSLDKLFSGRRPL